MAQRVRGHLALRNVGLEPSALDHAIPAVGDTINRLALILDHGLDVRCRAGASAGYAQAGVVADRWSVAACCFSRLP